MIEFKIAKVEELEHFISKDSILRKTALVAEENNKLLGVLEYRILNFEEAEILNYKIFKESLNKECFNGLIEEILYWNPYIKLLDLSYSKELSSLYDKSKFDLLEDNKLSTRSEVEVIKVLLKDIIPEQLTVEENKLKSVESWIDKAEDIVVSCVKIDGRNICIDGHSRLVCAYKRNYEHVYMHIDENTETKFYEECLKWCKEENILSIEDLSKRIVNKEEHQKLWIDRCQAYLRNEE